MFRQNLKICQKIDFTRFITFCPIMKVYALKALSIPEKSWRLLLVDVSTSTTNFVATISLIQSCTVQEITISSLQRSSAAPRTLFFFFFFFFFVDFWICVKFGSCGSVMGVVLSACRHLFKYPQRLRVMIVNQLTQNKEHVTAS